MDLTSSARALRRLRTACERAKISLSGAVTAGVELEHLFEGGWGGRAGGWVGGRVGGCGGCWFVASGEQVDEWAGGRVHGLG